MATMSVSEARAELPAVLDRVAAGEEITITRHGAPVAVVVHPDVLRRRGRADLAFAMAEKIRVEMEEARRRPLSLSDPAALDPEYAEELVADIRRGRDSRP
ncbi:type II toxin-antitoxin system Phd/YefM family antitoxin [Pseudactinotalea terrae]|uniref:type II toxin-antitoxin system Phd/YefM family antitoxin n=1 Tax=Pseudactinotalea terrae TaxID=1743262 RepID=UPI0012E19EE4|nr:type II toxin-antitoxin system Phd/YefM family antitoxin [Pseudactinotalea terrae]